MFGKYKNGKRDCTRLKLQECGARRNVRRSHVSAVRTTRRKEASFLDDPAQTGAGLS